MKKVLVVHPRLEAFGGGETVAAWTLQALKRRCELWLLTLAPVDWEEVNSFFGTTLSAADLHEEVAAPRLVGALALLPGQNALLEKSLLVRHARALDRRQRFDVVVSTGCELDVGRPAIQYIHYPWTLRPLAELELDWFHRAPGAVALYRAFCSWLARQDPSAIRRNSTLVNSRFVADRVRQVHGPGIEPIVVHPPVLADFPPRAWEDRADAIVGIGRWSGEKRWEMALEIVRQLRAAGLPLALHLVGNPISDSYAAHLRSLAAPHAEWLTLHARPTRGELVKIVAGCRYGLHTAYEEHFGIAVAELLLAGCIPFVSDRGGPVEIVGEESRLLFGDVAEAVRKIAAVVCSPTAQLELRRSLDARRTLFGTQPFAEAVRAHVLEGGHPAPSRRTGGSFSSRGSG